MVMMVVWGEIPAVVPVLSQILVEQVNRVNIYEEEAILLLLYISRDMINAGNMERVTDHQFLG